MRCADCNKFVSLDTEVEPEPDLSLDGTEVVGSVELYNSCPECGTELQSYNFDVNIDHSQEIEDHKKVCKTREPLSDDPDEILEDLEFDVEADSAERTTHTEGTGKKKVTYFGVVTPYSVVCVNCGEEVAHGTFTEEILSTDMEEC